MALLLGRPLGGGLKMGLFTRKPSRGIEDEMVNLANGALSVFGYALQHKTTNPGLDGEELDLTVKENRNAIRHELVRIINECGLKGCSEIEIGGERLVPIVMNQCKPHITKAAVLSAISINIISMITKAYYEDYPRYKPLHDMVNNLAKTCCTGAAQTIGADLPPEVVKTWPYFARIFMDAKNSDTWLWPDV